jgi:gliding motility-associated-like protein
MNFSEQLQARQIGNSVLWTPSTSLDNPGSYTPKFKGLNEQLYTIQLKTATGCVTVDTQLVRILKKIEIYVPTSFTPDGNGLNDYLRPVLMGFRSVNYFRVYNRWGKLLYQMQSDLPGWDGRINGVVQEMQTVVWMVEAVDVDGVTHQRKGTSILLR